MLFHTMEVEAHLDACHALYTHVGATEAADVVVIEMWGYVLIVQCCGHLFTPCWLQHGDHHCPF